MLSSKVASSNLRTFTSKKWCTFSVRYLTSVLTAEMQNTQISSNLDAKKPRLFFAFSLVVVQVQLLSRSATTDRSQTMLHVKTYSEYRYTYLWLTYIDKETYQRAINRRLTVWRIICMSLFCVPLSSTRPIQIIEPHELLAVFEQTYIRVGDMACMDLTALQKSPRLTVYQTVPFVQYEN